MASVQTTLTVKAVDASGNVRHVWTTVSQNGQVLKTGYTPLTFTGTVGQSYSVSVSNRNNVVFSHWANGNTSNVRTVTLHSLPMTMIAHYNVIAETSSLFSVNALDQAGVVHHMWTTVSQNGQVLKTGYTPLTFTGTVGQSYSVSVSDYNSVVFSHWNDGSTSDPRSITLGLSNVSLTAYYQTGMTPPPPVPKTLGSITATLSSNTVSIGQNVVVSGMVLDNASNPLPNVNLSITMGSYNTTATSDSTGAYYATIPTSSAGTFTINVSTSSGSVSAAPLSLTVTSVPTPPPITGPGKTGVYIPVYSISTLSSFLTIMKADGPSLPYIVSINPNSGPGSSVDSRFVNAIATLHSSGLNVTVIGYVPTAYGTGRTISNVEGMIDTWYSLYPNIDGIMFDEVSSSASTDSFYKTITDYARAHGAHFLRGNPGGAIDVGKVGMFDTIDVGESGSYPSASTLQSDTFSGAYSKAKFGFIVHDQASLNTTWLTTSEQYLGYVYITNAVEPNPYAAVPSYFAQEVAALQSQ